MDCAGKYDYRYPYVTELSLAIGQSIRGPLGGWVHRCGMTSGEAEGIPVERGFAVHDFGEDGDAEHGFEHGAVGDAG